MKLKEGKKYNIKFDWGILEGVYFHGWCDFLLGHKCDHCGKELSNGYIFQDPSTPQTTYEECVNGACQGAYFLGRSCRKKVVIREV